MNRIEWLINNTYQVVDNDGTCLFQGSQEECERYQLDNFIEYITTTPEILDVFERLANK
jgi:hypothetical protein